MRRFKSTLVQRNHFKHPEDDESTTSSDADSTDSGSDAGTTPRTCQDVDSRSLFDVWSASRPKQGGPEQANFFLPPGSRRGLTPKNIALASRIVCSTSYELLRLLSGLNPIRTAIMIFLTIIRGLLPAFRGYSQALILDEVNSFFKFPIFCLSINGMSLSGPEAHLIRGLPLDASRTLARPRGLSYVRRVLVRCLRVSPSLTTPNHPLRVDSSQCFVYSHIMYHENQSLTIFY